jgi:hypothetical protein
MTADNFEDEMDLAGVWNGPLFDASGEFLCPPFMVKLSDPAVYEVVNRLPTKQRGQLWPRDFTTEGGIQQKRLPSGGCVVGYVWGIPWVAVWRAAHVMSSERQFSYLQAATTPGERDWHFGAVVATQEMLGTAHVVEVDPNDFSFLADFTNIVMLFQDNDNLRTAIRRVVLAQRDEPIVETARTIMNRVPTQGPTIEHGVEFHDALDAAQQAFDSLQDGPQKDDVGQQLQRILASKITTETGQGTGQDRTGPTIPFFFKHTCRTSTTRTIVSRRAAVVRST